MVKKMSRWDKLLIIVLASAAFLSMLFIKINKERSEALLKSDLVLHIEIDGKEEDRYPLSALKEGQKLDYDTKFGHNVIEIDKDGVFVYEADCPDQLCVLQGKISRAGEIIVCLPHRLIASLSGEDKESKGIDGQTR